MHPPLINFSQLPQFHKSWCSHFLPFERKFEFVFSSNISKIPEFVLNKEMKHRKKREKGIKKKGRKAPKVSLLKKGNSIF
jgi:hypothetical protein